MPREQYGSVRAGIFVVASGVIIILFILALGQRSHLFTRAVLAHGHLRERRRPALRRVGARGGRERRDRPPNPDHPRRRPASPRSSWT